MKKPSSFKASSSKSKRPTKYQVGGNHYKSMAIQPVEFIHKNNIGYLEGNVIKYICRHRQKGGITDLYKAIHYCKLLLEMEYHEDTDEDAG